MAVVAWSAAEPLIRLLMGGDGPAGRAAWLVVPVEESMGTNSLLFYGLLLLGAILFLSAFLYSRRRRR